VAAVLVGLYLAWPKATAVGDAPVPIEVAAAAVAPAVAASDAQAYRDSLLARGLSLDETKPLVVAWLTAEARHASDRVVGDEYWQSGYAAAAARTLGENVAAADRVRAALLDVYGVSARSDAVFGAWFAPLDSRYAFLESEQQLALQRIQVERLLAQDTAPSRGSATANALKDLARLGPDAALEYVYRFSPLAEQLRSASIDLSRAEFRDAFGALLALESAADAHTFARTRETLRETLGDARFTRLWSVRDPYFNTLAATARQQGLVESSVLAAYAIFNDAQDRFAAAADRYAATDPQRAAAEAHEIEQDMQRRLVALLGESAAGAMLRAAARLSLALQQSSSTNLRE
jgi:hypothetical protein